jgi:histidinol-phosphate/aromatic aminotransferase/cobyric acid decarboxylase-like protein
LLIAKERLFISDALGALGLSCVPSAANFLLVETGKNVEQLCDRLRKRGILVRDCTSFGLPTNIRIAVRTREENEILIREIGSCLQ